jgi:hypothetical protein
MNGHAYASKVVLQAAAGATGNGVTINVAGMSRLGLQVTGTFVATVTFEVSIDGSNWVAFNVVPAASATPASTATAPGVFLGNVAGFALFRARVSAWSSGAVTVTALATGA